jgi:hypothetical protein
MAPHNQVMIGNTNRPTTFEKKSKMNWSDSLTKDLKTEMKKKKNMTMSK